MTADKVEPLLVVVDPPVVIGDTVAFSWTQNLPNPYQTSNSFYMRYENLDMDRFSPELLLEVFLGLQLRMFSRHPSAVRVQLPMAMARASVEFWKAFHGASRVEIGPVFDWWPYSPWSDDHPYHPFTAGAAVFLGGGKDSTCAACLLGEAIGFENVVLMHFISPFRPGDGKFERVEKRSTTRLLNPLREHFGFKVQLCWTDYLANIADGVTMDMRPNLEIYNLGMLPALLAWQVSYATFGHPYSVFRVTVNDEGRKRYRFRQSRPEMLAMQTRHYQRAFGFETTLGNLNLMLTGLLAFGIVVQRYPDAARSMIMCAQTQDDSRFCYQCKKCTMFAWYSLFHNFIDPEFDYDRLFATSRSIRDTVDFINSNPPRDHAGHLLQAPGMQFISGFLQLMTAIQGSDIESIRAQLSDRALANIDIIKSGFRATASDFWKSIPAGVVETINHPYAWKVFELLKDDIEVLDPFPVLQLPAGQALRVEFPGSMLTGAEHLPHLQ